jgi:hypothetical protein
MREPEAHGYRRAGGRVMKFTTAAIQASCVSSSCAA